MHFLTTGVHYDMVVVQRIFALRMASSRSESQLFQQKCFGHLEQIAGLIGKMLGVTQTAGS